ncbi:chemotaxis protein CheX [Inhella proteolytica]|uniref:Chemotaxis protein CheX n=1 Tax=Inhella proteolytica TaxID=2795029 RepID=A0A931J876_9BURK|nr:chemotaxis protein CheX [Inhella proteolytica]MBH9578167.1 chemotaxis protein CheX [Inhella proteolytica]
MHAAAKLQVKVLVLEEEGGAAEALKAFCEGADLLPVKVQPEHLMAVLRSSIDLGALFLSENYACQGLQGRRLAHELHRIRPELPIFLRCAEHIALSEADQRVVRHAYRLEQLEDMAAVIQVSLFSLVYPEPLVRGISELTQQALQGQFKGITLLAEAPIIVRDRLIYGEVYSLIPLEASWCRGYMMLQIEERGLQRLQSHQLGEVEATHRDSIRAINNVFSETTNLIWGAFKNRFIACEDATLSKMTQVPIVINHPQRYISFGSEDPQLCFRYHLWDNALQQGEAIELHQRFVFNLSWSPELFRENQAAADSMLASGELELF